MIIIKQYYFCRRQSKTRISSDTYGTTVSNNNNNNKPITGIIIKQHYDNSYAIGAPHAMIYRRGALTNQFRLDGQRNKSRPTDGSPTDYIRPVPRPV